MIIFLIIVLQDLSCLSVELPSFEQLHNIEPSLKTKVYDRNGILLKEFYSENRVLTPYKEMPRHLVDMLMAVRGPGVLQSLGNQSPARIIVAATNCPELGNYRRGFDHHPATVANAVSRPQQTLERKIKEALTAIKLERTYSKEEIIEMYLNQYYFGRGAYGISAAARIYLLTNRSGT